MPPPLSHKTAFSNCAVCVFDAYGTLLDVNAAAAALSDRLGDHWKPLAERWRAKQLEYTWLRSLMRRHADFAAVTADALDYALDSLGLTGDPGLREDLLRLYQTLRCYPEVPDVLTALKRKGIRLAVLSNATDAMLQAALSHASVEAYFDAVLSVDAVGIYKPDTTTYRMACDRFSVSPAEVVFISSNGWDVAGSSSYGFSTVWVNRAGLPVDRLPYGPAHVVGDLSALPSLIQPQQT